MTPLSASVSENPYLNGPPPKKRRIPFLNEMLLDMPDARKYSTLPSDQEAKLESFLQHLQPMHKEQRKRLLNRHTRQFREWIENSEQQIDDKVYSVHFSPSTFRSEGKEAMMLEASKDLITSDISKEALKKLPMEKRSVLVNRDQLVEMGKNQAPPTERGKGELNSVEFASYFGNVGVAMRREMCEEEMEMRLLQAREREMVMTFLMRLNKEKYAAKGGGGGEDSFKPVLRPGVTMPVGSSVGGTGSMGMGDPRRVLSADVSKAGDLGPSQQRKTMQPRPPRIAIPPRSTDPRLSKGQGGGSAVTTPSTAMTPRTATAKPAGTPGTAGLPPQSNHSSYFPATPTSTAHAGAPVASNRLVTAPSNHSNATGNTNTYTSPNTDKHSSSNSLNPTQKSLPNSSNIAPPNAAHDQNQNRNQHQNRNENQDKIPISALPRNVQTRPPTHSSSRQPSGVDTPRDEDTHMTGTGRTDNPSGDTSNSNKGENSQKNNVNSPLFFASPHNTSGKGSTESPLPPSATGFDNSRENLSSNKDGKEMPKDND